MNVYMTCLLALNVFVALEPRFIFYLSCLIYWSETQSSNQNQHQPVEQKSMVTVPALSLNLTNLAEMRV